MDKQAPRANEDCSLVYGDTLEKDFPLILVIGREPNNHCNVISGAGQYPSPDGSKFWMFSHGLIARCSDMPAHEFKAFCENKNASPIVFSDASPIGLDGRFTRNEKKKIREAILAADLEVHARTVFSQQRIVSRTAMVLISGVEECGLGHAMPLIRQQCESNNIPYAHIASLSAMTDLHTHKIRMDQIGEDGKAIIQGCTDEFMSQLKSKAA